MLRSFIRPFSVNCRQMSQIKPVKLHCLADVCLIPIGTGKASVSDEVAHIEGLIQSSGLKSTLHSAGTTIEGEWTEVCNLIGSLHESLHNNGVVRVQSDIRIGTRTDKSQTAADKIKVVKEKLAKNAAGN